MKFLLSEGRVICLMEKEDAVGVISRTLPTIELLLVPFSIKEHIENSHIWNTVIQKVKSGMRGVVYF